MNVWRGLYSRATGRAVDHAAISFYRLAWTLDDLASCTGLLRSGHQRNQDTERAWKSLKNSLRPGFPSRTLSNQERQSWGVPRLAWSGITSSSVGRVQAARLRFGRRVRVVVGSAGRLGSVGAQAHDLLDADDLETAACHGQPVRALASQ